MINIIEQEKLRIQKIQNRRFPIMYACDKINMDSNETLNRRLKARNIASYIRKQIQYLWDGFYNRD